MKTYLIIYPSLRGGDFDVMDMNVSTIEMENLKNLEFSNEDMMEYKIPDNCGDSTYFTSFAFILMKSTIKKNPKLYEIMKLFSYFPKCVLCGLDPELYKIRTEDKDIELVANNMDILALMDAFETGKKLYSKYYFDNDGHYVSTSGRLPYAISFEFYSKMEKECRTNFQFRNYLVGLLDEVVLALDMMQNNDTCEGMDMLSIGSCGLTNHRYIYHINCNDISHRESLIAVRDQLDLIISNSIEKAIDDIKIASTIKRACCEENNEFHFLMDFELYDVTNIIQPSQEEYKMVLFCERKLPLKAIARLSKLIKVPFYVHELRRIPKQINGNEYTLYDIMPLRVKNPNDFGGCIISTNPIKFEDTDKYIPIYNIGRLLTRVSLLRFFLDAYTNMPEKYKWTGNRRDPISIDPENIRKEDLEASKRAKNQ